MNQTIKLDLDYFISNELSNIISNKKRKKEVIKSLLTWFNYNYSLYLNSKSFNIHLIDYYLDMIDEEQIISYSSIIGLSFNNSNNIIYLLFDVDFNYGEYNIDIRFSNKEISPYNLGFSVLYPEIIVFDSRLNIHECYKEFNINDKEKINNFLIDPIIYDIDLIKLKDLYSNFSNIYNCSIIE